MAPLQGAAEQGLSVLALRHDRKSGGDIGDSARGSSGYSGAVDIVLDLKITNAGEESGARELSRVSRFTSAPKKTVVIELEDGSYHLRGSTGAFAQDKAIAQITAMLPMDAAGAMTLDELVELLGTPRTTVQRALKTLVEHGAILVTGTGTKGRPIRYHLRDPEMHSARGPLLEGGNESTANLGPEEGIQESYQEPPEPRPLTRVF